jgi:acyl carrier protein phosphodiesterase
MNFLAHAYLSFNQPEILVGNMISDFVKGKTKFNYTKKIQAGIELHRKIDSFTDTHQATKNAKKLLQPFVQKYAGAFVDVVYDHFLANHKICFKNDEALQTFASSCYETLNQYKDIVPPSFELVMPSMQKNNWLYNYCFNYGVQRSFEGLNRRAKFLNQSTEPYNCFITNYEAFKELANVFIPEVILYAKGEFDKLAN